MPELGAMAAFVAALIWWVLKDSKQQREELLKREDAKLGLEHKKVESQVEMTSVLKQLLAEVKESRQEQRHHNEAMEQKMDKLKDDIIDGIRESSRK